MEESAYRALYTSAYVFVFVIALTVTIFLFNSIVKYSDLAYKFNVEGQSDAVIFNAPVNENLLLSANEVISYYYNYVEKDLYSTDDKGSNVDYNISIVYNNREITKGKTFKELVDILDFNKKYILRYESVKKSGQNTNKKNKKEVKITIKEATKEEIESLQ